MTAVAVAARTGMPGVGAGRVAHTATAATTLTSTIADTTAISHAGHERWRVAATPVGTVAVNTIGVSAGAGTDATWVKTSRAPSVTPAASSVSSSVSVRPGGSR